ncbi:indole-diterpene biosynthesis protein-like protein PaxU [Lophiotrema nucula]|uniref:Indole-diterpene biosynthesis protein-like protein PaxU n=1 Tax=Lophiotrema nucula TaxID=690887 RepID=A0A6A5YI55_9PLEO|nr:indole-diterpene biosynthesis protein-like protein PaxU [Lophiotrema nucula]
MAATVTKLNHTTTLYTPESPNVVELIILCTWLGASKKHIPKYIAIYQRTAPSTPILHIQSSVGSITDRYPVQRRKIQDAATAVLRTLDSAKELDVHPKIMVHTFSNGGTNSATQLLLALEEKTAKPLPVHGFLCDSSPADADYWKSYSAMRLALPRTIFFNILGPVLIQIVLVVLYGSILMGRYEKTETLIRRTLLDEKYVKCGKIAYAWSKEDRMVDWRDVESHAERAREKGWSVVSREFVGAAHCACAVVDGKGYEGLFGSVWGEPASNEVKSAAMRVSLSLHS